ncbi:MAG: glycosyltransferase family 2 protein, partial [Caldimicrobium sp.]
MSPYPLSILIPTYNRRSLLEETLNSIFKDKASEIVEIIVVDDGSKDETWAYLLSLKEKHTNLKIYRHDKNLGVSAARNTALSKATASYIMFLDSDDYLTEKALSKLLEEINATKKEVYLISVWIEKGKKRKAKIFPNPPSDPLLRLKSFIAGNYADAIYVINKN